MQKIVGLLIALMLVPSVVGAEEATNRFVEEFKQWQWSLGGMAYLVHADDYFYAMGAKRDLGPIFNWLPEKRVYGEIGYLNSRPFNGNKDYGYAGLSTNANHVVQVGIGGVNKLLDANFKTPKIMDDVLTHVGILLAKEADDTFFNLRDGWDYGAYIAIIRQW